ncbi:MAG: U3 snoRNP protein [Cirrosporium novae-zelandiae]|nr:MAG: U3 snoRNP protein [Cirrosporium novae-zelandiae]
MAGASDKARFYLEQSVPELQEYERKGIFSKKEITSIAKKRSDFEHKLNSRGGSRPSDYARYVEYEINLEALRKKRTRRLGIKHGGGRGGPRRIFFIFDRGTQKFQGDISLWFNYLEYARKEKAYKKLSQILTNVLRLHPKDPALWIWASQYVFQDQADMSEARSYMQRGLRFCQSSSKLWLEYAKLEMIYITKITARQQILGLTEAQKKGPEILTPDNLDADIVVLPQVTAEDVNPSLATNNSADQVALQNLDATPALSGAIPLAIFDAGMKQFQNDDVLGLAFFDMFSEFENVPCLQKLLQHVVEYLLTTSPKRPSTKYCYIRQPTIGVQVDSPEFAVALGSSLSKLKEQRENSQQPWKFAQLVISWLTSYLQIESLDQGLRKVIMVTLQRIAKDLESLETDTKVTWSDYTTVISTVNKAKLDTIAKTLAEKRSKRFDGLNAVL